MVVAGVVFEGDKECRMTSCLLLLAIRAAFAGALPEFWVRLP